VLVAAGAAAPARAAEGREDVAAGALARGGGDGDVGPLVASPD